MPTRCGCCPRSPSPAGPRRRRVAAAAGVAAAVAERSRSDELAPSQWASVTGGPLSSGFAGAAGSELDRVSPGRNEGTTRMGDTLQAPGSLSGDQRLDSANGQYHFGVLPDGNLAVGG